MSKASGLGARFYVSGVNLSGDSGSLGNIATPRPVQEVTGVDKEAFERIYLTRDGAIEWSAFFNPASGQAHPVLSALPTADRPITYAHRASLGAPACSIVAKQIGYNPTRNANGSMTIDVQAQANRYAEWGRILSAGTSQLTSGAPNGSGLDFGATIGTTAFGLQAYLHVLDFVGTDVTLAIQHSDDDGSVDPYANVTGAVFTQVTAAPGAQRLQTDRDESIKRWLRVAATTTGGFTSVDVAVMVVKNRSELLF